jgi:hypothetical protein
MKLTVFSFPFAYLNYWWSRSAQSPEVNSSVFANKGKLTEIVRAYSWIHAGPVELRYDVGTLMESTDDLRL